jgi:hypothetical protein
VEVVALVEAEHPAALAPVVETTALDAAELAGSHEADPMASPPLKCHGARDFPKGTSMKRSAASRMGRSDRQGVDFSRHESRTKSARLPNLFCGRFLRVTDVKKSSKRRSRRRSPRVNINRMLAVAAIIATIAGPHIWPTATSSTTIIDRTVIYRSVTNIYKIGETSVGRARLSSRRSTSIASRFPATRLASAASASCDSARVRSGASVSSRPCRRTARPQAKQFRAGGARSRRPRGCAS